MTPADACSVLSRLLETADGVVLRLPHGGLRAHEEAAMAELAATIEREAHAPVEGERFVDDFADLLVFSLGRVVFHRRFNDERRADAWCQIAGVCQPVVRSSLRRALDARRTVRPSP